MIKHYWPSQVENFHINFDCQQLNNTFLEFVFAIQEYQSQNKLNNTVTNIVSTKLLSSNSATISNDEARRLNLLGAKTSKQNKPPQKKFATLKKI